MVKSNVILEAYGVFSGYQITDNLAAEVGYEYFGRAKVRYSGNSEFRHTAHGTTLALKGSYPVLDNLDVYARAGAALIVVIIKIVLIIKFITSRYLLYLQPVLNMQFFLN